MAARSAAVVFFDLISPDMTLLESKNATRRNTDLPSQREDLDSPMLLCFATTLGGTPIYLPRGRISIHQCFCVLQ